MIKYISVVFFSVFFAKLSEQREREIARYKWNYKERLCYSILLCIIILFMGLRTTYNDTQTIIGGYNSISYPNLSEFFSRIKIDKFRAFTYPGYTFVCAIMKSIGLNDHWFILLFTVFYTCTYIWFIRKYSDDFSFALLLLMTIESSMLLAAIKQISATAIALIAIDQLLKDKKIRFFLLVIVAATFHPYVLLFLITPVLLNKKPWSRSTWIMVGLFAAGAIAFSYTATIFTSFTNVLGDEYSADDLTRGGVNPIRVVVYMIPTILSYMYRKNLYYDSNRTEDLFSQLSILCSLFMFLALFGNPILLGRIPSYFIVFSCIVLPWSIDKIYNSQRSGLRYLAMICYFAFFVYSEFIDRNFDSRYTAISLWQLLGFGG